MHAFVIVSANNALSLAAYPNALIASVIMSDVAAKSVPLALAKSNIPFKPATLSAAVQPQERVGKCAESL